jgi:hypothetical protein
LKYNSNTKLIKIEDMDDIYDEVQNEPAEKKKKKKKRKENLTYASSAFDSNINSNKSPLHSLLRQLDFESKGSENLIVYLDLVENERKMSYRLKYDNEMSLIRVESLPIKWLSVDIRNEHQSSGGRRDIRFSVISQQDVKLHEDLSQRELFEKLKAGVLEEKKVDDEKKTFMVRKELRRSSQIFAKYSKSIKFSGGIDNWRSLFAMAKQKMPANVKRIELIELVRVCLCESDEYSEHDEREGGFGKLAGRGELIISFKLDLAGLSASDLSDLTCIVWHVAQVFLNIV